MEGIPSDLSGRHVRLFARLMAPKPSDWVFARHVTGEHQKCACGAVIWHNYILEHRADLGKRIKNRRKIVVGSTCIVKSVAWLRSQGALYLASQMETAHKQVTADAAKMRRDAKGLAKLKEALAQAALLDAWFNTVRARVQERASLYSTGRVLVREAVQRAFLDVEEPRLEELDPYWKRFIKAERQLVDAKGRTPGQKAANIHRRVDMFVSNLESLRLFLERNWPQPPDLTQLPEDLDAWFVEWSDLRQKAHELRNVIDSRHEDLQWNWSDVAKVEIARMRALRDAVIPATIPDLQIWIERAQPLADFQVTDQMRERKRLLAEAHEAYRQLSKYQRDLKRLYPYHVAHRDAVAAKLANHRDIAGRIREPARALKEVRELMAWAPTEKEDAEASLVELHSLVHEAGRKQSNMRAHVQEVDRRVKRGELLRLTFTEVTRPHGRRILSAQVDGTTYSVAYHDAWRVKPGVEYVCRRGRRQMHRNLRIVLVHPLGGHMQGLQEKLERLTSEALAAQERLSEALDGN